MQNIAYTVQKGDTVFDLALKFNISPNEIASINGLSDANVILEGQEIILPVSDEVYNIFMLGKNQSEIQKNEETENNENGIGGGDFSESFRRHRVRRGDTVYLLAKEYGTTVSNILALNPQITDVRNIAVGSVITVPIPPENSYIYVVRPNDTVFGIAQAKNTDVESIMRYNYIEADTPLYPGQQLVIVR